MNMTDITNALDAIKALPMTRLNERQGLLVGLLAEMVNVETSDGEGTELNECLEGQDWWQTLDCLTRDAGFRRLGNGHFSAAYSHPLLPNRVIKVGFKKEDSGAAYTAFCRMHQGRAGIPNIYDVQRHAGCYTVVLDALIECDSWGNDEHEKYAEIAREVIENKSQEYNHLTGWDGEFVETCKEIRKFFDGIARFDMHAGNIMFTRGDVPYITDPVSFSQKKDKSAFSLEPEVLLQEIEEMAHQKVIDKAIDRHARHAMRKQMRQMKRKARKQRELDKKLYKQRLVEWRQANRKELRNEQRAQDALGLNHWRDVWCNVFAQDFKEFEACVAAKVIVHDMVAIQAGQALAVDKMLDARFMG